MYRLKQLRKEKNLTQLELAKILKVSPSTIGMYEQGRRIPPADILTEMSNVFDVSIEYILGKTSSRLRPSLHNHQTISKVKLADGELAEELLNTALQTEEGKQALKTLIEEQVLQNAYAQFDKGLSKAVAKLMKNPDDKSTLLKIEIIKSVIDLNIDINKLVALQAFISVIK